MDLIFNTSSLVKVISHGSKHPQDRVSGVFIGQYLPKDSTTSASHYKEHRAKLLELDEGAEINLSKRPKTNVGSSVAVCYDVIPLAHTHTIPHIAKLASLMINEYCTSCDLEVLGYYQMNTRLDYNDIKLSGLNSTISNDIVKCFQLDDDTKIFTCTVNFEHLTRNLKDCFEFNGGVNLCITQAATELLHQVLESSHYMRIDDVDDHLFNVENDFLNPKFLPTTFEELDVIEVTNQLTRWK